MKPFNLVKEDLDDFKDDAIRMLDEAEKALLAGGQSTGFKELYQLLFKTVHGLKGAAQVFDLKDLAEHLRKIEIELTHYKDHSSFTLPEIGVFRKYLETAKQLVAEHILQSIDYNFGESKEYEMMASPIATAELSAAPLGLAYILDDEPAIVEILSETLTAAGLTTMSYSDPKELLEAFQARVPDVVISDMKMPGISGLEILNQVKKINADVPVIFISGYLDTPKLLDAIQKGVYAAIEKPFDTEQVVGVVLKAVQMCQLNKLLSRSMNLILYQFTDLKDLLLSQGKTDFAFSIEDELRFLLEQRRKFREAKRSAK